MLLIILVRLVAQSNQTVAQLQPLTALQESFSPAWVWGCWCLCVCVGGGGSKNSAFKDLWPHVHLKAAILYPPAGEWLQYETISRWGLTTIWLNWTNGLLRLINSMATELIRPVKYNPGSSQKLIKLEISSCRCSQLECNEENDETEGYSALYTPTPALKRCSLLCNVILCVFFVRQIRLDLHTIIYWSKLINHISTNQQVSNVFQHL